MARARLAGLAAKGNMPRGKLRSSRLDDVAQTLRKSTTPADDQHGALDHTDVDEAGKFQDCATEQMNIRLHATNPCYRHSQHLSELER